MAYVPGTAFVFTGTESGGDFVPDGHCWPAIESVEISGLVGWQGSGGLWGSVTHGRVMARVSCDDWQPE
jgi:hypothetical protein